MTPPRNYMKTSYQQTTVNRAAHRRLAMASGGCLPEISKRMQEGWTLLNQHCPMPSCSTPLLKDPKGEVFCVKCQMFCITENEAQSLGIANAGVPAPRHGNSQFSDAVPTAPNHKPDRNISVGEQPSISAKREARAAAEARMGDNLLLGWTMLADECPTAGCCFPLMRDKDRNTTCVACGGNGVVATNTKSTNGGPPPAQDTAAAAPPQAPAAPPTPTAVATEAGSGGLLSAEEFAAVRKKRDKLSAALGSYMLQGWSLLDTTCPRQGCEPGTPLLKDRSSGTLYCAGCDTRTLDGEKGGLVVEPTPPSTAALPVKRDSSGERRNTSPTAEACVSKAEPMQVVSEYELAEKARLRKQAAREQSSGALSSSANLAELLLQGWAMLSTICPKPGCHNPLMRDRKGTEVCVSCDGAGSRSRAKAAPNQAAGDLLAEAVAKGAQEDEEDEEDEAMLDQDAGRMYAQQRMLEITSNAAAAPAHAPAHGAVKSKETVVDHARVKSETLDTLYRALDVSQQRLRACSCVSGRLSGGVDESAREADLIVKLALATQAVFDLPTRILTG